MDLNVKNGEIINMQINFYNPKKLKIPMNFQLIVDNKYVIDYEKEVNLKSSRQITYVFTINLDNYRLKIDDIQNIMLEIGKILISQYADMGIELIIEDINIDKLTTHTCVYKLIFYKE